MPKITLTDITTGLGQADVHNSNNAAIEAALENTLSLDGTSPNALTNPLDVNSQRLLNVGEPTASSDVATKFYADSVAAGGTANLAGRAPRGNLQLAGLTGGTVTLTDIQFDNASFDLTGTLTSNLPIIVPDNLPQQFVVHNSTTGPFTTKFKHLATVGVVIPQGVKVILYTTGAVVEDVSAVAGAHTHQAIFRGAKATTAVNTAMVSGSYVTIPFELEDFDTDAIHDTFSRVRVPFGVTMVNISANALFWGGGSSRRVASIYINGANAVASEESTSTIGNMSISTGPIAVVSGDYFELLLLTNVSGDALTSPARTYLTMEILE